jgi:hypothetical protein
MFCFIDEYRMIPPEMSGNCMQDVICFDRIDRHLIQGASVALGGKVNPGQGVPAHNKGMTIH